ncbi:MAG: Uma2 family endonuclease, partial [Cyanobacteria bacterium P01_A01_bin.83]
MVVTAKQFTTDTWIDGTWNEYLKNIEHPDCAKAKGYYHDGKYRIEMTPIGNDYAKAHANIHTATSLYAIVNHIDIDIRDNCSYRKTGIKEFQPDLSLYLGDKAKAIPWGVGVIDLDQYPTPDLVIEVANTSLSDDLGEKRLLYEDLQLAEYWVVDVPNVRLIAFVIENDGSRRISESQVLTGLKTQILTEAFQRSRTSNHT